MPSELGGPRVGVPPVFPHLLRDWHPSDKSQELGGAALKLLHRVRRLGLPGAAHFYAASFSVAGTS